MRKLLKALRQSFITIFILLSPTLWAESIGLQEILAYATKNAVTLKIKQTDVLIESKNVQSAESAYYPSLNVVYTGEYNQAQDGVPFGTESVGCVTISNGTRYQSSLALQLNYDLYHFGATDKRVEVASTELDIKKMEWCSQEKQLHQQILQHYAGASKGTIEIDYRTQMLELRRKLYDMKIRLYKAGKYSKDDLGDEAIYVISLQRDIENISMQYQEDIIKLSQLSHKDIPKSVVLLPLKTNIEDSSTQGYDETTEGIIINKKILQKKDEISLQFREQLPSFGLYSSYYYYGTDPKDYDYTISRINKKSWNVGISLKYNIFEGFKHSSNEGRLKLELYRLEQELEEAKHNYAYEAKSKITRIEELKALKEHEQNLLDENYKKRDMLNRLYELKRIDSITKINAEYELLERALNIEIRDIDAAFESALLNILHRGTNQCSPH